VVSLWGVTQGHASAKVVASFTSVIIQILLLDIVFALDSVITAVGMVDELAVMIAAVVIAVVIMLWAAEPVSDFVNRHPTVKMLALSFLLLIGFSLVVEGLHQHIPRATFDSPWVSPSLWKCSISGRAQRASQLNCTNRMWPRQVSRGLERWKIGGMEGW
jgi:predicted tellurium resistance membrane protein TerC